MRKVGAPKGGRVHWLLWHLPRDFRACYELYYNYDKHNYVFARHDGRKLFDVFIIEHSSKHWWRGMYSCPKLQIYEHFGYKTTKIIAEIMYELYRKVQEISGL